jgi:thiamine-monophosphate kinase
MPKTPFVRDQGNARIESETDLVQTYLAPLAKDMPGAFGLADDAAIIPHEPGSDLVLSSDPVIAGVHFFADDRPEDIAWKALACNLSDLAAKGAKPIAYLLALALPEPPERTWMADFARGLAEVQSESGCRLIGGDTDHTSGPLSVGVTIIGSVPSGTFVPRSGAKAGDHVFVTGTIGDSALGLALRRDPSYFGKSLDDADRAFLIARYLRPRPRLALAHVLRNHASAALDISDGLLKDLLRLTGPLGLTLKFETIPLSQAARAALSFDQRVTSAILTGGDDYELLIAVAPNETVAFAEGAARAGISVHELGVLTDRAGIVVLDAEGAPMELAQFGYDHFSL